MSMHVSAYSAILYLLEGDIASVRKKKKRRIGKKGGREGTKNEGKE